MSPIATLPRLFGSLFYYAPNSINFNVLKPLLYQLPDLFNWDDLIDIKKYTDALKTQLIGDDQAVNHAALQYEFSLLFEGQGVMRVPPWGSVYLDSENSLMGESAISYHNFLMDNQLSLDTGINEPEDQFGLMLLSFANLIEINKDDAAIDLLEQHFYPWALRYLDLLISSNISEFYATLARIIKAYLIQLKEDLHLIPVVLELKF